MLAGKLDQRITIQAKQATQSSYGEETVTWTDVATVWAQVSPLAGREYLLGRAMEEQNDIRVRIRFIPNLTPSMRILHGNKVYDIQAVQNIDSANKELVLMCKEIING